MDYLCYADDSQLYLIIKQSDIPSTISCVDHSVSDIKRWMGTHWCKRAALGLNGGPIYYNFSSAAELHFVSN